MPGVSGVGDVEFSADEEGDRRRAAADDLVRLFVAKDQSEDEITNDVQSGAARNSQGFEDKNLGSSPAGGPLL